MLYHIINCLIPRAFEDDDILPVAPTVRPKYAADEIYWQRKIHIPVRGLYGRNNITRPVLASLPMRIDDDFWQCNLFFNLTWRVSLWRE